MPQRDSDPASKPVDLIDAELQRLLEQAGIVHVEPAKTIDLSISESTPPAPTIDLSIPERVSAPPPSPSVISTEPPVISTEPPPAPTIDLRLPASEPDPEPYEAGDERRAGRRHRLRGNALPVSLIDEKGETSRGRVRDISVSGGLFVETRSPYQLGSRVMVSLSMSSGQAVSLEGKVVRVQDEGFGAHFSLDELAQGFLNVAVAVVKGGERAVEAKLELLRPEVSPAEPALSRRWLEVMLDDRNDAVHQRFIEACLSARRVEYALERYRALKQRSPEDERIDKYLAQLGKILSFYAFTKDKDEDKAARPASRSLKLLLFLLVALAGAWVLLQLFPH